MTIKYKFWNLNFSNKYEVFKEVERIISFVEEHWRDIENLWEIWNNLVFLCDWWEDYDWLDFDEFNTKNIVLDVISIHRKYWYQSVENDFISMIVHYLINQWWVFDKKWFEDLNDEIVESWLYNSLMNEKSLNWDYKTNLTNLIENYSNFKNVKDLTNSIFEEKDWNNISFQDHFELIQNNFYRTEKDSNWETKLDFRISLTYFDWIRKWKEEISKIYDQLTYLIQDINPNTTWIRTVEWLSKNLVKFIAIECLNNIWLLTETFNKNRNWFYYHFNEQDYQKVLNLLISPEWVKLNWKEISDIKQKKISELDLSDVKIIDIFEDSMKKDMINFSYEVFHERISKLWEKETIFKSFKIKVKNFDEYLEKVFYEFEQYQKLVFKYWTEDLILKLYKDNWETEKIAKEIFSVLWEWFFNDMNETKMKILNQIDYKDWMIWRIWTQTYNFEADYDVIDKAFKTNESQKYLTYFWQFKKYKEELLDENWNKNYKDILIKVLKENNKIDLYDILKVYIRRWSYENELLQIDYIKKEEFLDTLSILVQRTDDNLNWLSIINLVHKVFEKNWIQIESNDYLRILKILSYNSKRIDHYYTVISEIYSKMFSDNNVYEKRLIQIENEKNEFTKELENNIKWITKSISSYKWSQTFIWKISKFFWSEEDEKEIYKQIVHNLEYISNDNNWKLYNLELSLKEIEDMLKTSDEFKKHIDSTDEELSKRFVDQINRNEWILELSKTKMNMYIDSYKKIWETIDWIKEKMKTLDILVWMKLIDQVDDDLQNKINELKKN